MRVLVAPTLYYGIGLLLGTIFGHAWGSQHAAVRVVTQLRPCQDATRILWQATEWQTPGIKTDTLWRN